MGTFAHAPPRLGQRDIGELRIRRCAGQLTALQLTKVQYSDGTECTYRSAKVQSRTERQCCTALPADWAHHGRNRTQPPPFGIVCQWRQARRHLALYCVVCFIVLNCTVLYCTELSCPVLYCTVRGSCLAHCCRVLSANRGSFIMGRRAPAQGGPKG